MSDEPITHASIIQWMVNGIFALAAFLLSAFAGVVGYIASQLAGHSTRILRQAETLAAIRQQAEDMTATLQRIHEEDIAWKLDVSRRLDAIEDRAERAVKVADEIVRKHQLKAQERDS
jgi:hypothetical protein